MSEPFTYNKYLSMSDTLPFEDADRIYSMLLENANTEDEDFEDLWTDFVKLNECMDYQQNAFSIYSIYEGKIPELELPVISDGLKKVCRPII